MKKVLCLASLFVSLAFTIDAQTLTVTNNTSCTINFIGRARPGVVGAPWFSSPLMTVPPSGSAFSVAPGHTWQQGNLTNPVAGPMIPPVTCPDNVAFDNNFASPSYNVSGCMEIVYLGNTCPAGTTVNANFQSVGGGSVQVVIN